MPYTTRKEVNSEKFLATLEADRSIDVRCRVTGYLKEIRFTPGDEVSVGDVLFVIDKSPFIAALELAQAEVKVSEADVSLALKERARIEKLLNSKSSGAVSLEDRDKAVAQVDVSQAREKANRAKEKQAEINLGYCEVKAELGGKISRNLSQVGNIVVADNTLLATIVDPTKLNAYFDVDQSSVQNYRRVVGDEDPKKKKDELEIVLGLEKDEKEFPYKGKIDYAANTLNPTTGALTVRGVFLKADTPKGLPALEPGYLARIRVNIGKSFTPVLIPDRAIGTDLGQKYVFIVNDQKKVESRKVELGNLFDDGLRAITQGLTGEERVIVNGLQRVRQGATVEPELVDPITELPLEKKETTAPKKK